MNGIKTFAVIISLLFISTGAVIIADSSDAAITKDLHYDDYIKCSSKAVATGSVEVVTINNITYVHADSIGTGSYTDKGVTYNVNVTKADLIVILMCGQSNGAYTYRAESDKVDTFTNLGQCYYYGDSVSPVTINNWSDSGSYGVYDMMDSPTAAHVGGIDEPMAVKINKETGSKVLVINTCISGMQISKFLPRTSNYTWAQNCFNDAISNIDTDCYNITDYGMFWIQGESNPDTAIATYQTYFSRIWATMNHGVSPDVSDADYYFSDDHTFTQCVISLVRQSGLNACCAQIQLSAAADDVSIGIWSCDQFTVENGLLYNDNVHYTQKGRNIVGNSSAIKFCEVFN